MAGVSHVRAHARRLTIAGLIRKAVTRWTLWRAAIRVRRACPEISAIPPITRAANGRFQSTAALRRAALHDRLRKEVGA